MPQNGKIAFWFSAPLLAALFFHMVCESMVVPILAPTLAEPISPAEQTPGFERIFFHAGLLERAAHGEIQLIIGLCQS